MPWPDSAYQRKKPESLKKYKHSLSKTASIPAVDNGWEYSWHGPLQLSGYRRYLKPKNEI
jgi:hypothetical protein